MKNLLITAMLFFMTPYVFGACNSNSCYGTIDRIYLTHLSTGEIWIRPSDSPSEVLNCNLREGVYMTLKQNHMLFDEIYSAALAALASQKEVNLRIAENSDDCELVYLMIDS
ncbi:hypothetical protein [Photobacterium rosenbergii]|uniref:Uncharacterized protein n=1 Tax=Photobacterium rosenbergii TaxID=294936 RepID=A0ABU3ZE07_9GAMM|nr:hypothetical protein [Photobacterium rosenbergii]MDV5168337.1 hypothetical protein [Photobacterium rosenbergii]